MTLLVSIHDVTPALLPRVESLWALCRARGVTPALLVVPDWHGAWPIAQHPVFLAWVRARASEGAEIILHGERHDEAGLPRTFPDRVRAFGRTNLEGEFLTLRLAPARERIDRGLALLRAHGLDPVGFIPPAWLMRADTIEASAQEGRTLAPVERPQRIGGFGPCPVRPPRSPRAASSSSLPPR